MIRLTAQLAARIRAEGESAWPNECCGLLLGVLGEDKSRSFSALLPIANSHAPQEQGRRFLMPPEALLRAERLAEEQGLEVLGCYHSHPDHPAIPSDYDREHALPFYAYLILAVGGGAAGELSAWELKPDRSAFLPLPLQLTSSTKADGLERQKT